MLFVNVLTTLSLAVLSVASNHKIHLNRNHNHDALAKRVPGDIVHEKRFSNSRWSWYDGQTGQAGACGQMIGNSDWVVALNTPQYGGGYPGPNCFKTITMTFNGKTAHNVRIMDQCPGCPWGGLDLTPALFEYFAPLGAGIIHGEWHFGGEAPPPPPPPPTTTWAPPPPPTTTWTPPPPPPPTTTWTPPPPTTTWTPPPPTTTWSPPPTTSSTPPATTSSSTTSNSSSSSSSQQQSSADSARPSASGSAGISGSGTGTDRPTATGSLRNPARSGSLETLNHVFIAMANVAAQGNALAPAQ